LRTENANLRKENENLRNTIAVMQGKCVVVRLHNFLCYWTVLSCSYILRDQWRSHKGPFTQDWLN